MRADFKRQGINGFFLICGRDGIIEEFWLAYGEYRGKRNIKHFKNYLSARLDRFEQDLVYRVYMADSFYLYGDNKRLSQRFYDILRPTPQDTRSGDEIALDIIEKLKGG